MTLSENKSTTWGGNWNCKTTHHGKTVCSSMQTKAHNSSIVYRNFGVHSHTPICWHKHLALPSTFTYKHALKSWSVPSSIFYTRWVFYTHRIECITSLKLHYWPIWKLALNWIVFWGFWCFGQKKKPVFTIILNNAAQKHYLKINGALLNAYKLFTHQLPCHLWPEQCSVVPSMLCKKSADKAVPAMSLSSRLVDTRHSAGTEVPESQTWCQI